MLGRRFESYSLRQSARKSGESPAHFVPENTGKENLTIIQKRIIWGILSVCIILVLVTGLERNLIVRNIWNFLVVSEEPKPSDVIIVISGGIDRTPYGVELYKQGYANTILLSGGGSGYMEKQALSLGVPKDHILLEQKSGTTFENAKYSSVIVRAHGFKSAILVTSPFHTRRAGMFFHQFFQGINLTVCAVPYDPSLADNWWKNGSLAKNVLEEYLKFVWHFLFDR